MAHELHLDNHARPIKVASNVTPRFPVTLGGTSALLAIPCATATDEPFGVTQAATYLAGEIAQIYYSQNTVKAVCGASTGAGANVIVGSTNGVVVQGGIAASNHWILGKSETAAGAGEIISIFVNPRKA